VRRLLIGSLAVGSALLLTGPAPRAAGLLPDRQNRVVIHGQFTGGPPAFLLVFSAQPLRNPDGSLTTRIPASALAAWKPGRERLALRVYGKQPSRAGQVEYAFGSTADAAMPWNNGPDFRWADWQSYSPDLWDHLSILAHPAEGGRSVVTGVSISKGGKVLYDSRARQSFPNRKPMDASWPPVDLTPRGGEYPVLNLAARMEQFRRDY
jgi:hypothetical protein